MSNSLRFAIEGLQRAQQANQRAIAATSPRGGLGRAVQYVLIGAQRYEIAIAHVDTGSLRASQMMEFAGARGMVFTDPAAINPRSGQRVIQYAGVEHARGYPHNYAARTVVERGPQLAQAALQGITDEMNG